MTGPGACFRGDPRIVSKDQETWRTCTCSFLWMGSLTKPKRQTRHRRRTDGGSTTISPPLYWWHVCVSTCLQDCWRSDTPTRLGNLYAMEKKRKQKGSLGTPCCLSLQQCSHSRYCALLLLSRDLTCLVFRHLGNIVYMIQWSVAGSSTQLFGNQSDCTWLKIR